MLPLPTSEQRCSKGCFRYDRSSKARARHTCTSAEALLSRPPFCSFAPLQTQCPRQQSLRRHWGLFLSLSWPFQVAERLCSACFSSFWVGAARRSQYTPHPASTLPPTRMASHTSSRLRMLVKRRTDSAAAAKVEEQAKYK